MRQFLVTLISLVMKRIIKEIRLFNSTFLSEEFNGAINKSSNISDAK
jgi:hypothetical protein